MEKKYLSELSDEEVAELSQKYVVTQSLKKIFDNIIKYDPTMEMFNEEFQKYQIMFNAVEQKWTNPRQVILSLYEHFKSLRDKIKAPISCQMGCSHCCNQNVDISETEAEILIDYVKENNISIDQELLKQQLGKNNNERSDMINSQCIFLKDHKCSVYEVRPIACRKFFSIDNPDLCNVKTNRNPIRIYGDFEMECYASAIIGLSKNFKNLNEYFNE
jgi:Fe-S-cluster containining protein